MSDMWRKTLVYLGLVEEPEELLDEQESVEEPEPEAAPRRRREAFARAGVGRPDEAANVRSLRADERHTHVRPLEGGIQRVAIVRPASFDDAEQVGDRYRSAQPVLMDLGDVDSRTGRRLLDFISGTIFALRGRILPAGDRAFLLVPDGVDVALEERRRLSDLGYRIPSPPTLE